MVHAASAGRPVIQFARLRPRKSYELLYAAHRERGVNHQDEGPDSHQRYMRKTALQVVRKVLAERRLDGGRSRGQQQCVTIRRRSRNPLGGNGSTCAGTVFNDDLLALALG